MFKKFNLLHVMENEKVCRRLKFFALALLVAVSIRTTAKASADNTFVPDFPYVLDGVTYDKYFSYNFNNSGNYYTYICADTYDISSIAFDPYNGTYKYIMYGSQCRVKYNNDSWQNWGNGLTSDYIDWTNPDNKSNLFVTDCTSYNYSDWSACDETGHQSRTLISGNPSGCNIVYPSVITTQTCDYIAPLPSNQNIWLEFMYPAMQGPIFHADYKMVDLNTTVPMRIKVNTDNIPDSAKSHWYVTLFRMVDGQYDIVNTTDPYVEGYAITDVDSHGYMEFTVPLIEGNTYYYSAVIAPDDTYAALYPDYPHHFKYNFSFTGLAPDDPNYQYGQSPVLPTVDDNGNQLGGTGSIVGDLIQTQLNTTWSLVQVKFADFFTLFSIIDSAPSSASSSSLYTGTVGLRGHRGTLTWDPFHELTIPSVVPTMVSFVAYLGLGWFLIRNAHRFFD